MDFKGTTALITGASSGIGEVFARELAARGADVVLVARNEGKLAELAGELASKHSVKAEVLAADLGQPGAGRALAEQVAARGLTVDVLINNAGFGFLSPLVKTDADMMSTMVALNVAALTDLTHAFLPGMVERDRGAVVNVASTAAFQPVPYMAVYGATKAYVLSFTEALWGETKGTGVRVTCLCPGATATAFFETAGEQAQVGNGDDSRGRRRRRISRARAWPPERHHRGPQRDARPDHPLRPAQDGREHRRTDDATEGRSRDRPLDCDPTLGGRSSAGRAPGCGPGGRGFESPRSPFGRPCVAGLSAFRGWVAAVGGGTNGVPNFD